MIKKFINEKNLEKSDGVVISAPYEKTASFHKGTKDGPKKVVECLDTQVEFFDRNLKIEINDFIKVSHLNLKGIEKLSPLGALKKIRDASMKAMGKGRFVFLLGGEHSVSLGLLQALSKKHNPKDTTILHIDAHCDLRDNDGDYSDNPTDLAHSAVMRRASELGYKLVQVGIRTYSRDEYEYFNNKKNNVKVFEWGQGEKPSIDEVIKSIKTKNIYISIDVDGFDPSFMPGTGTPVQGGLKWWYGIKLLEKAVDKFNLVGADIVEVSPQKDSVLTEYGAAQLAYIIFTRKFKNKAKKKS